MKPLSRNNLAAILSMVGFNGVVVVKKFILIFLFAKIFGLSVSRSKLMIGTDVYRDDKTGSPAFSIVVALVDWATFSVDACVLAVTDCSVASDGNNDDDFSAEDSKAEEATDSSLTPSSEVGAGAVVSDSECFWRLPGLSGFSAKNLMDRIGNKHYKIIIQAVQKEAGSVFNFAKFKQKDLRMIELKNTGLVKHNMANRRNPHADADGGYGFN
uniref:Uncharacterized protein n=1 Tax=Romanomermis culicivorax TaxID=13658 RepID=A0A915K701_ROMCU